MTGFRRLCCLFATLVALSGGASVRAQPAELTTVREVVALDGVAAGRNPRPARLRGVVTEVGTSGDSVTVDDGQSGVGVMLAPGMTCPALGDEIELAGTTMTFTVSGFSHARVLASQLVIKGRGTLPAPLPLSLSELNSFRHFERWVRIEAHVVRWKYRRSNNELVLVLAGPDDWTTIAVRSTGRPELVSRLMGAKLRLTGINAGANTHDAFGALIVPSLAHLEFLAEGSADIFAAPLVSMRDIAERKVELGARVKVRGTVLARFGERIVYLRGAEGLAQCVYLLPPHGGNTVWEEFADAGALPALKPGDQVEVIGSPPLQEWASTPGAYTMHFCHIRVTGSQLPEEPVKATLPAVAAGGWTHDFVQVRGRLLALNEVPLDRQRRTGMLLESGGTRMDLIYQAAGSTSFDTLKVDDEVLVSALVDRATSAEPRQLRLISPGDIKSLGLSPVVRTQRLWVWGSGGAAVLALLASWIAALRRSARFQAAAAANLEQSVNERTADLQAAQVELQAALGRERELGELKSRFVSMVSHEFRTPLGVIMSAVELLLHYSERLPEDERRNQLDSIRGSTKHMGDLMEQVLVLSRADAGKIGFRPQPIHLPSLAEKIVDETQSLTGGRCRIVLETGAEIATAHGDESLLRHILGNLIANAVKYSPAGSEVHCRISRESECAVFVVADRGIGIPEKDRPRLFEAFHRGSNVGETPGTGLGLVIVKRCVELHRGTIAFASETHAGTTFTVRLPLFVQPA